MGLRACNPKDIVCTVPSQIEKNMEHKMDTTIGGFMVYGSRLVLSGYMI